MTHVLTLSLLLGLWLSSVARGETAPEIELKEVLSKKVLDDGDTDPLFRRIDDEPAQFGIELLALWKHASTGKEPLFKARLGWWLGRLNSIYPEVIENSDIGLILNETIQIIESLGVPVPVEDIKYFESEYQSNQKPDLFPEMFDGQLKAARSITDPHLRAYALAAVSSSIADRRHDIHQLAEMTNEIRNLLSFPDKSVFPADVDTLQMLRFTLFSIGQIAEAAELDRKLDQLCATIELRKLCSVRSYNAGMTLVLENPPVHGLEAIEKFRNALALAEKISDQASLAKSHYGLSIAYSQTKNFDEAIENGLKSTRFFEKNGPGDWAASAYGYLSKAYLRSGKPAEALDAAQKALRICPPEFQADLMALYKQLADVYEVLKNIPEAFKYLKLYTEVEQRIQTDDANRKYMELRNQSLSQQNEHQAEQINLLSRFRLVSIVALTLTFLICIVFVKVLRQASVIRRSRQKMKDVMDHIDEGIVTLNDQLCIESGYSPHLDRIFEQAPGSLNGTQLIDLLFRDNSSNAEIKHVVRDILMTCLDGDALSWEFNQSHLPSDIQYKGSFLTLHWQPLYSSRGLIAKYLVLIRDITELKSMEKKALAESERVQTLQKKLEELLGGQVPRIRNLVSEIRNEWGALEEKIFQKGEKLSALQRLHTAKGAARTLGLKLLAGRIHEMESCFVPLTEDTHPLAREKWNALELSISEYEYLLNTLLSSKSNGEFVATDLYAYASLYAAEVKDRLNEAGCPQKGVMVLDHVLRWQPKVLSLVHDLLLHAISNAVDHGFIRPHQQKQAIQPALIQVQAMAVKDRIELQVMDNGAGINWSQLKKKAQEAGYHPVSDQSSSDLLFMEGVSTAEYTSETSGRGVGLSAVKSICHELGGTLKIEDAPDGGTILLLDFPASTFLPVPLSKAS